MFLGEILTVGHSSGHFPFALEKTLLKSKHCQSKWCEVGTKGSPGKGHSGGLMQEVGPQKMSSKHLGARKVAGREKGPSEELILSPKGAEAT